MKRLIIPLFILALIFALVTLSACEPGPSDTADTADTDTFADTVADETAPAADTDLPDTEPETEAASETETETEAETEPTYIVNPVSPGDGAVVSQLSDELTEWLTDYKKGKLKDQNLHTERLRPLPVRLTWTAGATEAGEPIFYYVTVTVASGEFKGQNDVYLCVSPGLELSELYAATEYTWQVIAVYSDDSTVRSRVFTFTTAAHPRTVYAEGISNLRDIGGYKTSDGGYVRQGLVFRGADLNTMTDAGRDKMVNVFGIRTHLDLRQNATLVSDFGPDVRYVGVSFPWYSGAASEEYRDALLKALRLFTDPDNYPFYFHCSLGRDRTGTLSWILLSLCGVDDADMYKDFEISFFSDTAGHIDQSDPTIFVTSNVPGMLSAFRKNLRKTRTTQDAVRGFLLSVGMTEEELDAIRQNLVWYPDTVASDSAAQ